MLLNTLNFNNFKIEQKEFNFNLNSNKDVLVLPCPLTLTIGAENKNFNIFDVSDLSEQNLNNQLTRFNKNGKINIMFLNDVVNFEGDFDVIVPFCKTNKVKLVVKAGYSLNEMGECDKLFGKTPIDLLEEFGVLDLEPIILSGAKLEKSDIEKLSYYNATVCLDLSNDLLNGNGVAPIVTMLKNNLTVMFNVRQDVFEEIKLAFMLTKGVYNCDLQEETVLKMAFLNGYKVFNVPMDNYMVVKCENKNLLKNLVLNTNKNMILSFLN